MKKVFCILLAALLLLPVLSIADDPEPITGTWYVFTDTENNACNFSIFRFLPDGTVTSSQYDIDIAGTSASKDFSFVGTWEKQEGANLVNIADQGARETVIENNTMFIPVSDQYSIRVRKMEPVDYSVDIMVP